MSDVIEISSEDDKEEDIVSRSPPRRTDYMAHSLSSSSSSSSDSEGFTMTKRSIFVKSSSSRSCLTQKSKSYVTSTKNKSISSSISSEEFPSPSKINAFQNIAGRNKSNDEIILGDSKVSKKCLEDNDAEEDYLNCSFLSNKSHHDISDSNSSVSLPSPVTKKKKKTMTKTKRSLNEIEKEKQRKAEEKNQKKREEAEKKQNKRKISESLRKFKPGECLKHLTTKLDVSITEEPYGGDVLSGLDSLETKYEITHQPLPSTVTWARDDNNGCEEHLLLIIWSGEKFVKLVSEMKIIDEIGKFKKTFREKRIVLVIFGFECYMKKLRKDQCKKKNNLTPELREFTKTSVDIAIIQLQLVCKCSSKILETRADVSLHVCQVTKAVAEMPFRLEKQKLEEKTDWHASSDNKNCVKVDKMGNGLARLWRQQLCQFNSVTLEMSDAIAQVYKTPTSLVKAYEVCSTRREGEKLLADILVRRGRGPSSTTRPIGIELSKKIYYLFNSTDPDKHLSQVQE